MPISTAQGYIGAGDLYITPIGVGDVYGARVDAGNVTKFAIKSNATLKEQKSKKRDSWGQVLESVALQDPAELSMTLETVNADNLRYCFLGADLAYTQTGATYTAETTVAKLGGFIPLLHEGITGAVTLTNAGASITYIEGTDYTLNRRMGWYKAIVGGAITDAQSLRATYTTETFVGKAIQGNVQPQIRAMIELDAINQVDGSIGLLRCWEVILAPASEFDFFKDDFNTIELTGKLKTPPSKTEPYIFYQR